MESKVLFEQGKYQMVQSEAKDGVVFSYDVVNKDTGNIERRELGFGYAVMWVKNLDFMYNKSLTDWDPDKEMEAERAARKAQEEAATKAWPQQSLNFPGTPTLEPKKD